MHVCVYAQRAKWKDAGVRSSQEIIGGDDEQFSSFFDKHNWEILLDPLWFLGQPPSEV